MGMDNNYKSCGWLDKLFLSSTYTLFQMRSVFGGRVVRMGVAYAAGRAAVEQH